MKRVIRKSNSAAASGQQGFTLLELIMVMTIMVILVAVSVDAYQTIQLKARETILKESLRVMRRALDEYIADQQKLPGSVEDIARAGYMRDVPIDPITGQADWIEEMGEDGFSGLGGQGLIEIRSSAEGQGTDGKAYRDY